MKKLFFLFTAFLIVSCTTEPERALTEDGTQSNIITTLKSIAQSNQTTDFVKYDLTIDENGNVSTANRRVIERTKHSEAYLGFQKKTNNLTIKLDGDSRGSGGIQVCCTLDGETYECDTCEEGPGQTLCVAQLVIDCVEAGGCSVTCYLPIIFDSLKNEFYILKK